MPDRFEVGLGPGSLRAWPSRSGAARNLHGTSDGKLNEQTKEKIMQRNNQVTTLGPSASSSIGVESPVKPSSTTTGAREDYRTLMTRAELILCLRDVHRYWSTPRISYQEIEELERQNLIQRNNTALCAIRLTDEGELVKKWQQLKAR